MSDVLRVNPIACDGHGLCAELVPELIRLDEWGYPIVSRAPVPRQLVKHAKRAVAACPVLALHLEEEGPSGASSPGGRRRRRTGSDRVASDRNAVSEGSMKHFPSDQPQMKRV